MIILGIETSCDETALALIEMRGSEYRVIQSLVHSQAELHSAYGGVFPTLAKREHSKNIVPLLEKLLEDLPRDGKVLSKFDENMTDLAKEYSEQNSDLLESFVHAPFLRNKPQIDRIAVTEGPGLEPALWVGITFARMLGKLWDIPVIPIDHMEGHVVASLLDDDKPAGSWQKLKELPTPAVALLISGGHTELVKIEQKKAGEQGFSYELLGQTVDDAVGEAFDKTARLLGLPYPGGPRISKLAHEAYERGIPSPVTLPRPMINSKDLNFSFSGLKTAVLYAVQKADKEGKLAGTEGDSFKKGLAREFQESVAEVLETKLTAAIEKISAQAIIIGGGVSANHMLRSRFKAVAEHFNIPLHMPSLHLSGDNALMIALVGSMKSFEADRVIRAQGTQRLSR